MRGLTYEELGAVYELRHGFAKPTPWKRIALAYGVTWVSLYSAIKRLERDGMHRDANGEKVLGRATAISNDMLAEVHKARRAGNRWPEIAAALGMKAGTIQRRYWAWKEPMQEDTNVRLLPPSAGLKPSALNQGATR